MNTLQATHVQCPYCWENIEIVLDLSVEAQTYTEDCSVCCRPILFQVIVSDYGHFTVETTADE